MTQDNHSPAAYAFTIPDPEGFIPEQADHPEDSAATLGLKGDEYQSIVNILGRVPSTAELGAYSVMWSEHCSYKSSKIYLKGLPTEGEHILVGPGENAGVVDVGGGMAVTFKIESHNHPSYVEPFQGAATGVGGIIRDIVTMGARPIALMNPLRFGDPTHPKTQWVQEGVVSGISHYGNCVGIPNVGGETVYDPSYQGNPLVNVLCAGLLDKDNIQFASAESAGDIAIIIGQRTGRDGIGGASVLASEEFGEDGVDEAKRPNVQVGDPFAAKGVIEACLELYSLNILRGIQDMGAAGIVCSCSEMASAASMGMEVDLDLVNLREPSMDAWEILCSESQERMLALTDPKDVQRVIDVCAKWGIQAVPIGQVVEGDRLRFYRHGELEHDVPARSLAHDGPVYHRPVADWVHPLAGVDVDGEAAQVPQADWQDHVMQVLTSYNIAPPAWIIEQYDAIVGHNTMAGPGGDAAVLRLRPDSPLGIALATDGNGRVCSLDPAEGARRVVAEAARNVACTGALPIASTNCLNFGSPERPEIMGQFRDTIRGMSEAVQALGVPITGGNVSFYNQTGDTAIHPTPVMGILGSVLDIDHTAGNRVTAPGVGLALVGNIDEDARVMSGSEWDMVVNGRIAGPLTPMDLEMEAELHALLIKGIEAGTILAAHDISVGGLITALTEMLREHDLGITVEGPASLRRWLGEPPTQALVAYDPANLEALQNLCVWHGLHLEVLGTTDDSGVIQGPGLALRLSEVMAAQAAISGIPMP